MAKLENNCYSKKCLVKQVKGNTIYLYKSFDLVHGYGYFCQIIKPDFDILFGFSKKSKIRAVKNAFLNL